MDCPLLDGGCLHLPRADCALHLQQNLEDSVSAHHAKTDACRLSVTLKSGAREIAAPGKLVQRDQKLWDLRRGRGRGKQHHGHKEGAPAHLAY